MGNRLKEYEGLSSLERHIMQLCAVMYEPRNKTSVWKCFVKSGLPFPKKKCSQLKFLTPHLESLQEKGLLDDAFRCHASLKIPAAKDAVQEGFFQVMADAAQALSPFRSEWITYREAPLAMRDFLIAFHTGNAAACRKLHKRMDRSGDLQFYLERDPYLAAFGEPFDIAALDALSLDLQRDVLSAGLREALEFFEPVDALISRALTPPLVTAMLKNDDPGLTSLLLSLMALTGRLSDSEKLSGIAAKRGKVPGGPEGLAGARLFMAGRTEEALESYEEDLKRYRERTGKRTVFFRGVVGIFHILTLLKLGGDGPLKRAGTLVRSALSKKNEDFSLNYTYHFLGAILDIQRGELARAKKTIRSEAPEFDATAVLFRSFAAFLLNGKLTQAQAGAVEALYESAKRAQMAWVAMECAELLFRVRKKGKSAYRKYADAVREQTGISPVVTMFRVEEPWRKSLRALIEGCTPKSAANVKGGGARLVWLLGYSDGWIELIPKEQKPTKAGGWTKGRNVAMKRLMRSKGLDFLTDQDRRIAATIVYESRYYYGSSYRFDMSQTLPQLVGHPLLFSMGSPETPVEMVLGEPEISVKRKGQRLRIAFEDPVGAGRFKVVALSETRFQLVEVTEAHRRIAGLLGDKGLFVPKSAEAEVMETVAALSRSVTVHSELSGKAEAIEERKADPMPHVRLLPAGSGFSAEMVVKPLGEGGPHLKPGEGQERVITRIEDRRLQTLRDLEEERQLSEAVTAACPTLAAMAGDTLRWQLSEAGDCLSLLIELKALRDTGKVTVEWPEGETMRVTSEISFEHLSMKIESGNDWLAVSGELAVEDGLVLDMKRLLDLVRQSEHRFIELSDGRFIALTEAFRRKLQEMASVSSGRGKSLRLAAGSALFLDEFAENLPKVKSDKTWKTQVKRLREGDALTPSVPSTLKAELREYQVEGFRWMMRLAHWGMGACLADDMGLGKTVQTLAVILARAPEGPTLVVAPTSVCGNWIDEAARFAPTLSPILFGGKGRKKTVENLAAFDLLVVSYTLLQHETQLLTATRFCTVVLDEAQAIKNMATKRSRAAMALSGDFRIITTGTPVENNLGEFRTLFNFINPDLLGSVKSFNERFSLPIEKQHCTETGKRLRRMVRPFILRRLKSQVLEELPPRTEVTLHVTLGPEEAALYEAMRRQAAESLENVEASQGQGHLKILAEIMRLRRACCHPTLVAKESELPGAKLALFGKVVEELLENRHKALVFSQFTGHLAILREYLDRRKIAYRYLDGSTPAKKRKAEVAAFQAGEGEFFLISLKAGGVGLNLTAASYVIHMDPWWNPAVEDQASDRAHRIGQQQPVTVYRLVTAGTIEDKIVALHKKKRDLADSLLSGTDVSGKISTEELLALIRER